MNLKSFFSLGRFTAAAKLAAPPLPKPAKDAQAFPGYRRQIVTSTSPLKKATTLTASLDRLVDAKQKTSDYETIKGLRKTSPELGSASSLLIRTAIPDNFVVTGFSIDGKISPEATQMAHELLRRLTFLGNVDGSFGPQQGLQSLSETLATELLDNGALCLEVALDKLRIPASMNAVAVSTLVMYEEDKSFRLAQKVGGDVIDLDLPTIIYVAMDQNTTDAYATSPYTSAVQPILTDLDFNNDIRRALKRAVLPRLTAKIQTEEFRKTIPPEIMADPVKLAEYQNETIRAVETVINSLNPEDALVSFDYVDFAYIEGGHDPASIIERVQKVLNAKLVAGGKTLPVALGFAQTSNASSSEALLFLKQADGIRKKLNEAYSRALTVAVRLMGIDGYITFVYEDLDLRPTKELEAYKAMRQSRILQLLSLGMVSDEQACLELTGQLPPDGYQPKSGTMFMAAGSGNVANPNSPTSAVDKDLEPGTPKEPKN